MVGPEVSIVVPTHDRCRRLPRLLASMLAQDHPRFELVVVDDGSRDDTQQVLAACGDPRLRVLRHEQGRGVSAARNTGTRAARGRFVAWCDDDDIWAPDKLRLQVEALQRTPGAGWCTGGAAYVSEDLALRRITPAPRGGDVAEVLLTRNIITSGSGVLADRELVLSLGGFDPTLSIFADWDMWARLAQVSPLAVVDLPLVGYVDHSGGMSHQRKALLAEFSLLHERLRLAGAAAGRQVDVDLLLAGTWMLRQQVSVGRRWDTLVLPFQLLARRMMLVSRAVPYGLVGPVAPQLLMRQWAAKWQVPDERNRTYAQHWLSHARRTLPAVQPAAPASSAVTAHGSELRDVDDVQPWDHEAPARGRNVHSGDVGNGDHCAAGRLAARDTGC